ncbi:M20 metallopeptidase family protein [Actinacidiphila rubida]|uniref:Amidohydrolase n=1 Tax=Actinacidiphila rubida TaxID=310780 RepID=A0A1H8RA96_9ACTN|nr:M20/M25/M40 family metallo-hydrolase [Actinacidiphila rubida]SEO63078.1 amidohydrolase [Actinacidiphila rubida]SEP00601.1 amidohydrolase [Actinacidiphila rubida]
MTNRAEELIELRREIHRRPELAGQERETAGLVAEQLRAAGLEVTTGVGGHGVLAVLDGSADGPTVAYRADMDAVDTRTSVLPFPRSGRAFDEGFASRVPGAAHLCGHDLHTAIGVGVARALAQDAGAVRGRLVFVFQPAEENLQGARAMLETGLVHRLAPREFYALHCGPFPSGTIGVSPGYGLPGLDHIRITLPGGDDAAVTALAARVAELGTVGFPQSIAEYRAIFHALLQPETAASVQESVCVAQWSERTPDGHPVANVLLRAWPQERLAQLRARVGQLAAAAGGHVEFPGDPFPAMVNSAELSTAAGRYLSAALGPDSVVWARASWPFNCEDFALFLDQAPGAQFYLGVADAESGRNGAPHTPDFAAD